MNDQAHNPPELLTPAGDDEAMRAGVANGADAVYFGLDDFNARRRAANFPLGQLPEVMDYLHRRNVRGYVAFNTLIFSDDLDRAAAFIAAIADAGADAVIVQDLGLVHLVREMSPTLPIHASTQMTQTHPDGFAVLKSLGVSRVILARELSLADIGTLARATDMELEVFVHGALCISFSGQCLASESLWGRSANRGVCGQACRLPYQLIVDGKPHASGERPYPLSPKDLAAHDRIRDLVNLGVRGFKIEGRLKNAAYVAAATRVYRQAIDAALQGRSFTISHQQQEELAQSFTRGFTRGFLDGLRHQDLVHGRFPKSRGTRVGTVASKTASGVLVELEASPGGGAAKQKDEPLKPGDGVVFDEGHPERDEQGGRLYSVEPVGTPPKGARAAGGRLVELTFGRGDINLAAISVGSIVWKTDDPAVRRRIEHSYSRDVVFRRVPVNFDVEVSADNRLTVRARDATGLDALATADEPLHEARRHPLTVELLRQQFDRLGDSPFELGAVTLTGPTGPAESVAVLAPKSVLNDLRRRAVNGLIAARAARARHPVARPDALAAIRRRMAGRPAQADSNGIKLYLLVRRPDQLSAALDWHRRGGSSALAMVYADMQDWEACGPAVSAARSAGLPIALAAPRILMPGEDASLRTLIEARPDAVLVRNLGSLHLLRRNAPGLLLIGDHSLDVANGITAACLLEAGLVRLTGGFDLNLAQWSALRQAVPHTPVEAVVHAHVPMFHLAHCLAAAALSEGDDCRSCGRPCRKHVLCLRDRLGVDHPVALDAARRTTVFNGHIQSAVRLWPELAPLTLHHVRIELLDETPDQVAALLDVYDGLLAGRASPADAAARIETICATRITTGTWIWP